jgi:hypothetical protein
MFSLSQVQQGFARTAGSSEAAKEKPMTRVACSALVVVAGFVSVAQAQTFSAAVTVHWKNTGSSAAAPTQHPVQPGESVDIWINVAFAGPANLLGLSTVSFDLQAGPNVNGTWLLSGSGFNGSNPPPGGLLGVHNNNWNSYGQRIDLVGGWPIPSWGRPRTTAPSALRRPFNSPQTSAR